MPTVALRTVMVENMLPPWRWMLGLVRPAADGWCEQCSPAAALEVLEPVQEHPPVSGQQERKLCCAAGWKHALHAHEPSG